METRTVKEWTGTVTATIAVAVLVFFFVINLTGCHAGLSLEYSQERYKSEKAVFEILSPRFAKYVEADTALSTTTKEDLLWLLHDWKFRLREDSAVVATAAAEGEQ